MFFRDSRYFGAYLSLVLALVSSINVVFPPSSYAKLLQGGVEVNDSLPAAPLKLLEASVDTSAARPPKQDCLCFNNAGAELKNINGNWKIVDKDNWIMDFGSEQNLGQQSLDIIRHYKLNNICFVGRPFQDGKIKMMYFLADGLAPDGAFPGEDTIIIDPAQVKAQEIGGRWKLVQDSLWLLDFNSNREEALNAEEIVKYYGFTRQCFVGRPGPPMMYWRK